MPSKIKGPFGRASSKTISLVKLKRVKKKNSFFQFLVCFSQAYKNGFTLKDLILLKTGEAEAAISPPKQFLNMTLKQDLPYLGETLLVQDE